MSHSAEVVVGAIGVVLLVAAWSWRSLSRWKSTSIIKRSLNHPDPAVRSSTLSVIGDIGLTSYIGPLTKLAEREHDPQVLATLAEIVARNQWEPADNPRLVDLRLKIASRTDRRDTADDLAGAGMGGLPEHLREVATAIDRLWDDQVEEISMESAAGDRVVLRREVRAGLPTWTRL